MKRKEQVGVSGGQGLLTQCIFFMFIYDLVPKEPIDRSLKTVPVRRIPRIKAQAKALKVQLSFGR